MPNFRVTYHDKWIICHAPDIERAEKLSIILFQFKYPKLTSIETDNLKIVEEPDE